MTPRNVAHQAPLSIGLSRQEYWRGQPFPSAGDLPHPGLNPGVLHCRWILCCLSHQGNTMDSWLPLKIKLLPLILVHEVVLLLHFHAPLPASCGLPLWLSFFFFFWYSCHLFLIFSASVRSIPFLSFIEPIFA